MKRAESISQGMGQLERSQESIQPNASGLDDSKIKTKRRARAYAMDEEIFSHIFNLQKATHVDDVDEVKVDEDCATVFEREIEKQRQQQEKRRLLFFQNTPLPWVEQQKDYDTQQLIIERWLRLSNKIGGGMKPPITVASDSMSVNPDHELEEQGLSLDGCW